MHPAGKDYHFEHLNDKFLSLLEEKVATFWPDYTTEAYCEKEVMWVFYHIDEDMEMRIEDSPVEHWDNFMITAIQNPNGFSSIVVGSGFKEFDPAEWVEQNRDKLYAQVSSVPAGESQAQEETEDYSSDSIK